MDNLREFVKKNRAAFDTEPLDEGHRGRFAAKLARGTERGASVLLRRFWAAGCAAAVVLGLLWLRTGHSQGDPVRRVKVLTAAPLQCNTVLSKHFPSLGR